VEAAGEAMSGTAEDVEEDMTGEPDEPEEGATQ
jgi:hypothetical protein